MQKAHGGHIHHFISKLGNNWKPLNSPLGISMCVLLLRVLSLTYAKERASKLGSAAALNPWSWDQAASSLSFLCSILSWHTQEPRTCTGFQNLYLLYTASAVTWTLYFSSFLKKGLKGTPRDHVKKSYYSRHFLSSAIRKFIIICRMQQVKNVKSCKARAEAVSGEVSRRNVLLWNEVWVNRSVETELLGQEETHFMQRH